jgi:predicted nucleic acid-binding protein
LDTLILDTNHLDVLWYKRAGRDRLVTRLENAQEYTISTTIINVQEKFQGWISEINSGDTSFSRELECYRLMFELTVRFPNLKILPFDEAASKEYERLTKAKVNVKPMDKKIAAIALVHISLGHNIIILTQDTDDFLRVPELANRVEDWTLEEPVEECTW